MEGTAALVEALLSTPASSRPSALVSTSAVGFYGTSETGTFSEDAPAGDDFLAQVCIDWEKEAMRAVEGDVRVVIIRAGIVLSREGGALGRMLPVFNAFSGGPLGSGQQWCSWIHRDDLIGLYLAALGDASYSGAYNGTAPNPVRMAELCAALGGALGRPSWLPVPDFAIKVRRRGERSRCARAHAPRERTPRERVGKKVERGALPAGRVPSSSSNHPFLGERRGADERVGDTTPRARTSHALHPLYFSH